MIIILFLILANCALIGMHYFRPSERELRYFDIFKESYFNSFLYFCIYKQLTTKYWLFAKNKLFRPEYGDEIYYNGEAEERFGEHNYFDYRSGPNYLKLLFGLLKIVLVVILFQLNLSKNAHFLLCLYTMAKSLTTFMIGFSYFDEVPTDMILGEFLCEDWYRRHPHKIKGIKKRND